MPPMTPEVRRAHVTRARDLFNAGEYWLAHEALETVWRSIISDGDAAAARVWQGLIQAATRCRGRNGSVSCAARASACRRCRTAAAGVAGGGRRTEDR